MDKRKLILYISMSLDGFIATEDDDLSWLSIVEKDGEDYGYKNFNETVDTYIVGRITYDNILKLTGGVFPQAKSAALRTFFFGRAIDFHQYLRER